MSLIFSFIVFSIFFAIIPFYAAGWMLKGWSPLIAALLLLIVARYLGWGSGFSWWVVPFQYLLILGLYGVGGEARIKKSTEEASAACGVSDA